MNFTLNQDKGTSSLKIHDNVLLSRVFNECEHDSFYVSKVQPVNKIHAQSCKRNTSKKFKVQTFRYTNADLKIYPYARVHIRIIP